MIVQPLKTYCERYRFNIADIECAVPYWINWSIEPYFLNAPYRGKGYSGQIVKATKRALTMEQVRPQTPHELRDLMRRHGLGVDCSGFVYRVLDGYMRQFRKKLSDGLVVHPEELRQAEIRHPRRLSVAKPAPLLLSDVAGAWHKDPAMITSVQRLIDPLTSSEVKCANKIQVGDLISMTSTAGDHIAIVVTVTSTQIEYAASEDSQGNNGGLRYRSIQLLNPTQGLEHQEWDQSGLYNPALNKNGVHRLHLFSTLSSE